LATLRGEDNPTLDTFNDGRINDDGNGQKNGFANNGIEMMDIAEMAGKAGNFEDCRRETKQKAKQHLNVAIPLFRAFGGKFAVAIALKVVQDVLKFVAPQILKKLIK